MLLTLGVVALLAAHPAASPYLDALRAYGPGTELEAERRARLQAVHRAILLRLIERLDQIAAQREAPADFAHLAMVSRHLLVWALQFLRDEQGLAWVVDTLATSASADPEIALARGILEELRMLPDNIAASEGRTEQATERSRSIGGGTSSSIETTPTVDEHRREEPDMLCLVAAAARAYERVLETKPEGAEPHIRLTITYEPSVKEPGFHAVEIQVKGRRGLTIHARRGYQR